MPNLGPDYDLAVRLRNLENLVGQLARNQIGQAFSATQSDGSVGMQIRQGNSGATATTWYQGPSTARDSQTGLHPPLLGIGEVLINGTPNGTSAVFAYRPDGSKSMIAGNGGVTLLDPKGNVIFSQDTTSGEGLADPWIPLPSPAPTVLSSWPNTNATSPGLVAQSISYAQHPKLYWNATVLGDPGVTGSVYLQIVQNGTTTVTGPTHTFAAGQTVYISDVITLAQPFWLQQIQVNVYAQVTGGTGKTYCQTFGLYGRQT